MIAAGIRIGELKSDALKDDPATLQLFSRDLSTYSTGMGCSGADCELQEPPAGASADTKAAYQRLKRLQEGKCEEAYPGKCKPGSGGAPPPEKKECDATKRPDIPGCTPTCDEAKGTWACGPVESKPEKKECDAAKKPAILGCTPECRDDGMWACGTSESPAQKSWPRHAFFFDVNLRAGSGVGTEGGINIPGIVGDMETSSAPLGAGLRLGYAYNPTNFLLLAYAGVEAVFPFEQADSYGNFYRPSAIWQPFVGVAPYYDIRLTDGARLALGVPIELGYSAGGNDLTINAPIKGDASYPFLRFGPEARLRFVLGDGKEAHVGLGYMFTPRFGDNFGQNTADMMDTKVRTWIGQHLFMLRVGLSFGK